MSYKSDIQIVHHSIISFITEYPSEDWVKPVDKYKGVRKSMKALKIHFSGERNATRKVVETDRMKEILHYKLERSLIFRNVLTKLRKICSIYGMHGEPMTEDTKIRFLSKKIGREGLIKTYEVMKTKIVRGSYI